MNVLLLTTENADCEIILHSLCVANFEQVHLSTTIEWSKVYSRTSERIPGKMPNTH